MKKEIAKKWAETLRSNKYKQGESCLKETNVKTNKTYHCCLGVLCELYNEHMKISKKKKLKDVLDKDGQHSFNNHIEVLPEEVRVWSGLISNNGTINSASKYYDSYYTSLSAMNDFGCSFKKIANVIDKDWKNI
jgi:hypothetical protein